MQMPSKYPNTDTHTSNDAVKETSPDNSRPPPPPAALCRKTDKCHYKEDSLFEIIPQHLILSTPRAEQHSLESEGNMIGQPDPEANHPAFALNCGGAGDTPFLGHAEKLHQP